MVDSLPSIWKALGLIFSTHVRAHTPENLAWMTLYFTLLSPISQHHQVCINRTLGGLTHAQEALLRCLPGCAHGKKECTGKAAECIGC